MFRLSRVRFRSLRAVAIVTKLFIPKSVFAMFSTLEGEGRGGEWVRVRFVNRTPRMKRIKWRMAFNGGNLCELSALR